MGQETLEHEEIVEILAQAALPVHAWASLLHAPLWSHVCARARYVPSAPELEIRSVPRTIIGRTRRVSIIERPCQLAVQKLGRVGEACAERVEGRAGQLVNAGHDRQGRAYPVRAGGRRTRTAAWGYECFPTSSI